MIEPLSTAVGTRFFQCQVWRGSEVTATEWPMAVPRAFKLETKEEEEAAFSSGCEEP